LHPLKRVIENKKVSIIINDALNDLELYGEKAEFLRGLTLYIKNRNK